MDNSDSFISEIKPRIHPDRHEENQYVHCRRYWVVKHRETHWTANCSIGKVGNMKSDWRQRFQLRYCLIKTKKHLSMFVVLLFVAGCSTDSINQELGGVATVSALTVALPLIPFAGAYHAISGDIRKEKEKERIIQEKLNPIYQKRIEMVKARLPKADADQVWKDGVTAFLSAAGRDGGIYPGLESTEFNLKDHEENQRRIDSSNFLTYLQTLLSDDPLQQQARTFSRKHNEFFDVCLNYEESFNREMYQRIQNSKSSSAK
jgi:hypothetical protein